MTTEPYDLSERINQLESRIGSLMMRMDELENRQNISDKGLNELLTATLQVNTALSDRIRRLEVKI